MQTAASENVPVLLAVQTYVRDIEQARAFWREHCGLVSDEEVPVYRMGDVEWRLLAGAQPCGTARPHGVLPAFLIDDFGAARGYLQARGIPLVFEEMIPGLNVLVLLDSDGTPIALHQPTDPSTWKLSERKLLRTRRRQDTDPGRPITLHGFAELTVYVGDITAGTRFYREIVGLPLGYSVFGHVHLLAANTAVVLRQVNWRCRGLGRPHATEAVFGVSDLDGLARRLQQGGYPIQRTGPDRLTSSDPDGWPVHFRQL
ncbi:MAG: hypothetical protein D6775_06950 [Caldilineae bacterium]|nr:MAG: hypothetical protein D6775_06950 [Caldilineae bacterium]